MKPLLTSGLLALVLTPATLPATTFFANYQPEVSLDQRDTLDDLWPGFITPHGTGAADSLGTGSNYIGAWRANQFAAFSYSGITTTFEAPATFTASYITFAAQFSNSFANFDTLTGVSILNSNGTELGYTRVRVNTLRAYGTNGFVDYTLPFGTNQTGGSGGFNPTPVTFQEGETYTVVFGGVPAGSAGGYLLANSTTSGAATSTVVNYTPNSDEFQPAFALNDGTNSVIPEPSALLLAASGTGFLLLRRRTGRRCR